MKKFLILFLLFCPQLVLAQTNASLPQSNQNIGPGDCSGAITVGGTAQNAFPALRNRKGFQIVNIDTTEVMWINFTSTALAGGAGSFPLPPATITTFAFPGSYYSNIGFNTALSVVAATSTHKYSCTMW